MGLRLRQGAVKGGGQGLVHSTSSPSSFHPEEATSLSDSRRDEGGNEPRRGQEQRERGDGAGDGTLPAPAPAPQLSSVALGPIAGRALWGRPPLPMEDEKKAREGRLACHGAPRQPQALSCPALTVVLLAVPPQAHVDPGVRDIAVAVTLRVWGGSGGLQ